MNLLIGLLVIGWGLLEAHVYTKGQSSALINGVVFLNSGFYVIFGLCLLCAGI